MPLPPIGRVAGAAGQAAGAAGRAAGAGTLRSLLTNPQVIAGAAGGVADVMGQRSQQRIAEQQMEQQASQFQQQFDVAEEERKRQQAQANRLAGLFMPTR
jgi:ATP-dependent protease HslVU (ClpYQ) peptidase subunit